MRTFLILKCMDVYVHVGRASIMALAQPWKNLEGSRGTGTAEGEEKAIEFLGRGLKWDVVCVRTYV